MSEPPAEHRAITLPQLQLLAAYIAESFAVEEWRPARGQGLLVPEKLNLYDLNYNFILPKTLHGPLRLRCHGEFLPGAQVVQASTGARGVVVGMEGDELLVTVKVGKFLFDGAWSGPLTVAGEVVEVASCALPAHSSVVGLWTSEPQQPAHFVSHWWGEAVLDFLKCLQAHAQIRGVDASAGYWVCAYANDQHDLAADVGASPKETSFFRAMSSPSCGGLLLVLNEAHPHHRAAVAFTRVWCAFEVFTSLSRRDFLLDLVASTGGSAVVLTDGLGAEEQAAQWRFDAQPPATFMQIRSLPSPGYQMKTSRERNFPLEILETGLSVRLEAASASFERDRRRILNCLIGAEDLEAEPPETHVAFDVANQHLRGLLAVAVWPQACARREVERLRLPEVLRADSQLRELTLCFSGTGFSDLDAVSLAQGFPELLESLTLNLAQTPIHDAGLSHLFLEQGGRGLRCLGRLTHLELNLCSTQLSDSSLISLSGHLRSMGWLRSLTLDLRGMIISNIGVSRLAEAVKGGAVSHLRLNLAGAAALTDPVLEAFAENLPRTLRSFRLNMSGCHMVSDKGATALAKGLLKQLSLQDLEVSLGVGVHNIQLRQIRNIHVLKGALGNVR